MDRKHKDMDRNLILVYSDSDYIEKYKLKKLFKNDSTHIKTKNDVILFNKKYK